ncbi:MAG: hypothetical protein EOP04_23580 [Proteobacteria bacterium]|nr:MAG: hypothetical protein EOP04_23580 [Pseudomonadota bacterium]
MRHSFVIYDVAAFVDPARTDMETGLSVEEIETLALIKGMIKKHSDNKDYYFYKHSEDIGFTTKAAKTKWVAVELSSNTAHGYPFPESDVPKNIVEYFK